MTRLKLLNENKSAIQIVNITNIQEKNDQIKGYLQEHMRSMKKTIQKLTKDMASLRNPIYSQPKLPTRSDGENSKRRDRRISNET